ncbi:tripartite tricarboxylate transporter TctB family protein [Nitratireductor aquibiodomus]|uniref:tripartite tricarboxylate transporter TctB family protein n=1 Tax=Nitratireductor aquibiodomus TaxID=204799 RepID=UPI0019D359F2|nr:tripartite tricarboxylate transporter TctB family protein [Nitratireductor aquibiodomus]MBN7760489.1 tripartite tricarboxylate transporter TctB family protein [Nitratireductor aquibiodomus]
MTNRTDEESASAAEAPSGHETLAAGIGLAATVLLILSPWLVDRSGPDPFYKGPLIFPMIVLAGTALSAVPAILRLLRHRAGLPFHVDGNGFPGRAAALFVLMCLYPLGISAIGLSAATFLAVLIGLLMVYRRPWQSVAIAAIMTLTVHLAFKTFLDIWFPAPWLFEMIGA